MDATTEAVLVGAAYRDAVSTQSYGQAHIDGVRLTELRLFSDEGGDFCEVARLEAGGALQDFAGFTPAQLNYSLLESGAVKAWHLHRKQDDLWFVPPGRRLLVGLHDVREDSPTYQTTMRFAMGAGRPALLFIPRGVAHGLANLGGSPACRLYIVNQHFDAQHPDEHRLPHDLLGADFWTIRPG
jgi:dTDP-4-dehydrorhamnose 3,5-epimerase